MCFKDSVYLDLVEIEELQAVACQVLLLIFKKVCFFKALKLTGFLIICSDVFFVYFS